MIPQLSSDDMLRPSNANGGKCREETCLLNVQEINRSRTRRIVRTARQCYRFSRMAPIIGMGTDL